MATTHSLVTSNNKYITTGGKFITTLRALPGIIINFSGYIISDQGALITERGFVYGVDPGSLISSVISSDTTILFTAIATVIAGTYYYKAYAINNLGTSYGELKSIIVS